MLLKKNARDSALHYKTDSIVMLKRQSNNVPPKPSSNEKPDYKQIPYIIVQRLGLI